MTSERHHDDSEIEEARELLSLLGLETLIQTAVERGTAAIVTTLEEIKVTLEEINNQLTAIEGNEANLGGTLTTIATNVTAIKDQLAGATGGLSGADAATLQGIADQASALATQSAP
jgi:low affinity Fe/Cu permease